MSVTVPTCGAHKKVTLSPVTFKAEFTEQQTHTDHGKSETIYRSHSYFYGIKKVESKSNVYIQTEI